MSRPPWILDEMKREVFVVTTASEPHPSGMIITWIAPAGLIPDQKRVMMALSPTNHTTQVILGSAHKRMGVHLLSKQQANLVPLFGGQSSRTVNKFETVDYVMQDDGIPILSNCCGWFLAKVVHTMDTGDRIIVIADIEKEEAEENQDPLHLGELGDLLPSTDNAALGSKFEADIVRDRGMRADFDGRT